MASAVVSRKGIIIASLYPAGELQSCGLKNKSLGFWRIENFLVFFF